MCSLSLKNQFSIKKKSLLLRCFFNNFWSGCCLPTYQFSINKKSLLLCPKFVVRDNMFNDDMFSLSFKHQFSINNQFSIKRKLLLLCPKFVIRNNMFNFWSVCCLPTS